MTPFCVNTQWLKVSAFQHKLPRKTLETGRTTHYPQCSFISSQICFSLRLTEKLKNKQNKSKQAAWDPRSLLPNVAHSSSFGFIDRTSIKIWSFINFQGLFSFINTFWSTHCLFMFWKKCWLHISNMWHWCNEYVKRQVSVQAFNPKPL